jgi:hypothetical protein
MNIDSITKSCLYDYNDILMITYVFLFISEVVSFIYIEKRPIHYRTGLED